FSAELLIEEYFSDELEIAIEPENIEKRQELEDIFEEIGITTVSAGAVNNSINIQVTFNSDSMIFYHRDELKMSVMADRDCYFKVIHIDANNQIKMVYPNSFDKNNYLRANTARNIFETASYMLYEPYGAETIIVVASTEQFYNIENDYITPWTAATTETVRTMVRGFRGGDLEIRINSNVTEVVKNDSEAVYTITIVRPDEKHEYSRPDNLSRFVQELRTNVINNGGYFEGSETSGFYIANGVRRSYRVPRDAPDKVHFAIYYLNN
ncbi:MAG: DUF4384 domain-containing protein, partial [Treponema sp.]|nr:DUF4384 domain-containing protein [Treponema sp.]